MKIIKKIFHNFSFCTKNGKFLNFVLKIQHFFNILLKIIFFKFLNFQICSKNDKFLKSVLNSFLKII